MAARAKNRKTFKRLLLLNQIIDFEIIIQECTLGDPLPKLLKTVLLCWKNGRQGYKYVVESIFCVKLLLVFFLFFFLIIIVHSREVTAQLQIKPIQVYLIIWMLQLFQ